MLPEQDSEFAVDWALGNLYRTGDVLHLLHCIPANSGGRTTFSDGVNEQLVTVDTASGADAIIKQRHWAIMDAVRKQFEAKLLAAAVPAEDLVYDIVQERRPDVTVSGMFGVRRCRRRLPPQAGIASLPGPPLPVSFCLCPPSPLSLKMKSNPTLAALLQCQMWADRCLASAG